MYDENIKLLANAIVLRACVDYEADRSARTSVEHFIMSDWFTLLTRGRCDSLLLINFLREGVKNGKAIYCQKNIFGN